MEVWVATAGATPFGCPESTAPRLSHDHVEWRWRQVDIIRLRALFCARGPRVRGSTQIVRTTPSYGPNRARALVCVRASGYRFHPAGRGAATGTVLGRSVLQQNAGGAAGPYPPAAHGSAASGDQGEVPRHASPVARHCRLSGLRPNPAARRSSTSGHPGAILPRPERIAALGHHGHRVGDVRFLPRDAPVAHA